MSDLDNPLVLFATVLGVICGLFLAIRSLFNGVVINLALGSLCAGASGYVLSLCLSEKGDKEK